MAPKKTTKGKKKKVAQKKATREKKIKVAPKKATKEKKSKVVFEPAMPIPGPPMTVEKRISILKKVLDPSNTLLFARIKNSTSRLSSNYTNKRKSKLGIRFTL
jgi:hypothetical protein